MNKIIIERRGDVSWEKALGMVKEVVSHGKISGNGSQHCYLTCFKDHMVYCHLNAKSEKFTITPNDYGGDDIA